MIALPIDPLIPEIAASLRQEPNLVLEAPPGAGKTTRVPPALLDVVEGEIVVLEPRRLAARLAARRVAEERGEPVGETVGYQVRFEEVASTRTRVRFVTEGVLTRRLLADPELRGVGVVVLDEFHERHLQGDLALALARRLQRGRRPGLRIVVMSATLEASPIAEFLGCAALRAEGRRFEVAVEHADRPDDRPLEAQVAAAVRRVVSDDAAGGDVLVFLPGAAEIARAGAALAPLAAQRDLLVVPLHGDLPPAEQDRAVLPAKRRKVILSTNVAETSVTIEGVGAVVDSGLARVASHSPWSGVPLLRVARVSQASAAQRAGRAGRTRAGRCVRLYTKHDHDTRPQHDAPEIRRLDLAELALALHAAGVADPARFEWFEAPPAAALAAAGALLSRLGAIDGAGALTAIGRRMLRFPAHPRLERLLVEAEARGVAADGCVVAAWISEGGEKVAASRRRGATSGPSDLLDALERFREDPRAFPTVDRARRQLERLCDRRAAAAPADPDGALRLAVLAAFPDRVARRRRPGSSDLLLAAGGTAELADRSVVRDAELLVAVDVEERRAGAAPGRTRVRVASAVEPEALLELCADALRETTEVTFNSAAERVEAVRRLLYDEIVLEERRSPPPPDDAARVLAEAAVAAGPARFADPDDLDRLRGRVAFVAGAFPELAIPPLDDAAVRDALAELCAGRTSFAELRDASLVDALRRRLPADAARRLHDLAPERLTLAGGRTVRVTYEPGKPPWIASRLQDFFGMRAGPTVAAGRVPVVLHLLAPNQRAVQITTDLAGFWDRHYPTIRRELMRRYPRHAWPEDPLTRGRS